jgi:hypothetical protein
MQNQNPIGFQIKRRRWRLRKYVSSKCIELGGSNGASSMSMIHHSFATCLVVAYFLVGVSLYQPLARCLVKVGILDELDVISFLVYIHARLRILRLLSYAAVARNTRSVPFGHVNIVRRFVLHCSHDSGAFQSLDSLRCSASDSFRY